MTSNEDLLGQPWLQELVVLRRSTGGRPVQAMDEHNINASIRDVDGIVLAGEIHCCGLLCEDWRVGTSMTTDKGRCCGKTTPREDLLEARRRGRHLEGDAL